MHLNTSVMNTCGIKSLFPWSSASADFNGNGYKCDYKHGPLIEGCLYRGLVI